MKKETIINVAESMTNGDKLTVHYERPVKLVKNNPFGNVVKRSVVKTTFDDRNYFQQSIEHNGVNVNPIQEESLYEKVMGMVYTHKKTGKLYLRIASPKSRLEIESSYLHDGKSIDYATLENYLYSSERRDTEKSDRQAVEGMDVDTIIQLNYNLEKVVAIDRVK